MPVEEKNDDGGPNIPKHRFQEKLRQIEELTAQLAEAEATIKARDASLKDLGEKAKEADTWKQKAEKSEGDFKAFKTEMETSSALSEAGIKDRDGQALAQWRHAQLGIKDPIAEWVKKDGAKDPILSKHIASTKDNGGGSGNGSNGANGTSGANGADGNGANGNSGGGGNIPNARKPFNADMGSKGEKAPGDTYDVATVANWSDADFRANAAKVGEQWGIHAPDLAPKK